MTYITGTLTDINPPATLYAAVDSALAAAGYVFVETVTISTRTHKIWKNPAANNATGKDWYLNVAYTTTGLGTFGFYVYEDYDSTLHQCIRPVLCQWSDGTLPDATYGSRFGSTKKSLEDTSLLTRPGTNTNMKVDQNLPTTSFAYWISISKDRVAWLTSINPNDIYYAGAYSPSSDYAAAAGAGLFPLVMIGVRGQGNTPGDYQPTGGLSRIYPYVGSVTGGSYGWSGIVSIVTHGNLGRLPRIPSETSVLLPKSGVPYYLWPYDSFKGGPWGKLIDVLCFPVDSALRGDTVTLTGITEPFILSTHTTNFSGGFRSN